MNTPHVLDELSAYIDNATPDATRVARHLQSCPECARRHLELLRLSAHVRALPAPAVSDLFAPRVMAAVDKTSLPRKARWNWTPARGLAAACTVVVAGALGLWWRADSPDPVSPATVPLNTAWQDDEHVIEAFARLMDEGVSLDLFADMDVDPEDDGLEAIPLDSFVDVLADGAVEASGEFWESDDLSTLLDAAAELDEQTLGELIDAWKDEV